MILKQLIQIIEDKFPPALAYKWDNVGLLAGHPNRSIQTVLVTVDVNSSVAQEAAETGADLILSHHPILMNGIKNARVDTEQGKMLQTLLCNDISVYAAHTNLDIAPTGINAQLATLFGLKDVQILADEQPGGIGLGRIGKLKHAVSLGEFAQICKTKLNTPAVRISGNPQKRIQNVAIGSGSCSEYISVAIEKGADVMLTADMKYHPAIDAVLDGIAVVDAGHYPTEMIAMDIFTTLLQDYGLKIFRSSYGDIFRYY